jgi:hypothetical protein
VVLGWAWWAVDDNTVAAWGTDFFHWSLVKEETNNVNSQFMDLIQGSLVTDSLPMLDLVGELLNPIGSLHGCIALTADFEAIDHCLEFVKDDLASLRHNDARKLAELFFFVTRNKIGFNFRPRPIPSNTIRAQFPPAGSHLTRGSIITLDHGP